jgi:hypothetical protein
MEALQFFETSLNVTNLQGEIFKKAIILSSIALKILRFLVIFSASLFNASIDELIYQNVAK